MRRTLIEDSQGLSAVSGRSRPVAAAGPMQQRRGEGHISLGTGSHIGLGARAVASHAVEKPCPASPFHAMGAVYVGDQRGQQPSWCFVNDLYPR